MATNRIGDLIMAGILQVLIAAAGAAGPAQVGFEFWANGQPVVGESDGTMTYWADGQPVVVEEV